MTRLLPALLLGSCALLAGKRDLGEVKAAPDKIFQLRADQRCDPSCGIFYRVGNQPWALIGFTNTPLESLEFRARLSGDDRWAALVDRESSHVLLALHDFQTGFSWPACQELSAEDCAQRVVDGVNAMREPGGRDPLLATQAPADCGSRVLP